MTGRDLETSFTHPPLDRGSLRWTCDPGRFAFEKTAELEQAEGIVGQDAAIESLRALLRATRWEHVARARMERAHPPA